MNGYERKAERVLCGKSKIYENWKAFAGVSVEDFLAGLKWVCEDPLKDYGITYEKIQMTRELGCTPNGELVKLRRVYDDLGDFVSVYADEKWGSRWTGPCINCRDQI